MARDHPYNRSVEKSIYTSNLKTYANKNKDQNNNKLENITRTTVNYGQSLHNVKVHPKSMSDFGSDKNRGQKIEQQSKIHQIVQSASQNQDKMNNVKLLYIDKDVYEKLKSEIANRFVSKNGYTSSNSLFKVNSNEKLVENKEEASKLKKNINEQYKNNLGQSSITKSIETFFKGQLIVDASKTPLFLQISPGALNTYNNSNIDKNQQRKCDQIYPVALRMIDEKSKTKIIVNRKINTTEDFILGL